MGVRRPPLLVLIQASETGQWNNERLTEAVWDLTLSQIHAAWDNDLLTVGVYAAALAVVANTV